MSDTSPISEPLATEAPTSPPVSSLPDAASAALSESWGRLSGDGDWEGKPRRLSWLGNAFFGVALIAAAISADFLYRRAGRQRLQAKIPAPAVTVTTSRQPLAPVREELPPTDERESRHQPAGDARKNGFADKSPTKEVSPPRMSESSPDQDSHAAGAAAISAEEQPWEMVAGPRLPDAQGEVATPKPGPANDQERIASQTKAALAHIRELQAQRLRDKMGVQHGGGASPLEERLREEYLSSAGDADAAAGRAAQAPVSQEFEFDDRIGEQGEQVGQEPEDERGGTLSSPAESGAEEQDGIAGAAYPQGVPGQDGAFGSEDQGMCEEEDLPAGMTLDELSQRAKAASTAAAGAVKAAQRAADASACAAQAAHRATQQAQRAMAASASAQAALRLRADDALESAVERASKAELLAEQAAKEAAVAAAQGAMHEVDAAKLERRAAAAAELSKPYSVIDQVTGWWRGGRRAVANSTHQTVQGIGSFARHTRESTGALAHGIRHGSGEAVGRAREAAASLAQRAQQSSADLAQRMQASSGTAREQTQQAFLYVGTTLQAWWAQLTAWAVHVWTAGSHAAGRLVASLQAAWGKLVLWVQQLLKAKSG